MKKFLLLAFAIVCGSIITACSSSAFGDVELSDENPCESRDARDGTGQTYVLTNSNREKNIVANIEYTDKGVSNNPLARRDTSYVSQVLVLAGSSVELGCSGTDRSTPNDPDKREKTYKILGAVYEVDGG